MNHIEGLQYRPIVHGPLLKPQNYFSAVCGSLSILSFKFCGYEPGDFFQTKCSQLTWKPGCSQNSGTEPRVCTYEET